MTANTTRRTARILGYAGLIPFYVTACWPLVVGAPLFNHRILFAQFVYAAVISSFLGAVHWGLELARAQPSDRNMVLSVMPGLAGWSITIFYDALLPSGLVYILFIVLFGALYANDRRLVRSGLAPDWYGGLRLQLTVLVIASFLISLIGIVSRMMAGLMVS